MLGIVDLNADVGESYGLMKSGKDELIIPFVSSVNIATGFHSGDPDTIKDTVSLSKDKGIGAHPSYPDLQGFGRRFMEIPKESISNLIAYQIGALSAFLDFQLSHVKPHGALYNAACSDIGVAQAIFSSVKNIDKDIIHVTLANSEWDKFLSSKGVKVAKEGFADRALNDNGLLVPRSEAGAVIHNQDQILERVVSMVSSGEVKSISGKKINIRPDTICLHGDNEESVNLAKQIRDELIRAGCEVKPMKDFIKINA